MISNITTFFFTFVVLTAIGCAQEQDSYTQTITSTEGLTNAELSYRLGDSTLVSTELASGDISYAHIDAKQVAVEVSDASGTTTFTDVPSKYANLDAIVEVTRNVFQDYFPEEWAAMKGQPFTTIYIKSKKDNQVFYMKCVFTNTDKEIRKYSEDF